MAPPTVAVIGGGFSGISAAVKLRKELGIYAQIFEATSDIGGTWNYNTYPGCACDIPSHLYSFSFELNPYWSHKYSPQKEIHEYMKDVAKKHKVYDQVQFNTKAVRATWIEEKKKWELELHQSSVSKENQIKYFDFIFSGIGALRVPNIPKQFQSFEGKIIHSSSWDNDYDFTDKNVAVIGSGTSAVQIVPSIIDRVKHLHHYIRTPTWVAPKEQHAYSDFMKFIFAYVPFIMLIYRVYIFLFLEYLHGNWIDAKSKGALQTRNLLEKHIEGVLKSHGREDLASMLTPNFPVGCKRIGYSDEYLPALCKPNCTIARSPITSVQGRTITTADGIPTEVDTLILATGFDVTGFLGDLQVQGRSGVSLNELWDESTAKTYKTVSIHNFPNFFIVLGPGSALGHNTVVSILESQIEYGVRMIKYMIKNNISTMDPTEKAQETFSSDLQSRFKGTVWTGGCKSWYMNKHGDIQSLWPGTVMQFFKMLKTADYESDFIKN